MEERGSIYKPPCKQKVSFPWGPWERMREGRQSQSTGCSSCEFPGPDRVRAVDQLLCTSGCLWGLVLILSSLRAPASSLAASTGSQCFSRQNVTNWGWSSTSCRSKSVLLAVFAQGILGVSFLAPMPSDLRAYWFSCPDCTSLPGLCCGCPASGTSTQYIFGDRLANFLVFWGRIIATPISAFSQQNSPTAWFPSVSILLSHSLPLSFPPSPIHL